MAICSTQNLNASGHQPWNKGKLIGQKPPLKPKQVWAIRSHLQLKGHVRELAMFNLAIDSKLRACDLMRAVAFSVAVGSYTFLAVSVIGHTVLIAAAAITVATWTAAATKPDLFVFDSARQKQERAEGQNNNN